MKKLLSCVLAGALALQGTQNIVNAADQGRIKVNSASVCAGETFDLPIVIEKNPGIAALNLSLIYDADKLELLGAEDGKILGTSTFLTTDSTAKIPYFLSWDDLSTENNTGTGTAATLSFRAKDNSAGNAKVSVEVNQRSTYNVDLEEVTFETISGTVSIVANESSPAIIVDTVSGNQGDTVEMPIRIQNNPGIAALNLSISYDNTKLKLLNAEDGKILGTSTYLTTDSLTKIPYILSWDDLSTENNTGNGIVATLKYEILASEGNADVELTVNQRSTYNVDLEEVAFSVMSGAVIVKAAESQTTSTKATTTTTKATTTTAPVTTTTTKVTTTTVTTSTTAKPTTTVTTSTTAKPTTTVTTSTTAKPTTTVTTSTTTNTKETLMGDVNGDGEVSIADAVLLCRITAEDSCDDITLTEQSFIAADYDKDNLITILDVMKLLKYLQAHAAT